jgi:multisubunit Na+/H+ antiporter MnhB subunit
MLPTETNPRTSKETPPQRSTRPVAAVIRVALALVAVCAILSLSAPLAAAQTETVLYNFTGIPDGANPLSQITFDSAGNLYGTTVNGGSATPSTSNTVKQVVKK